MVAVHVGDPPPGGAVAGRGGRPADGRDLDPEALEGLDVNGTDEAGADDAGAEGVQGDHDERWDGGLGGFGSALESRERSSPKASPAGRSISRESIQSRIGVPIHEESATGM